jgi:hypothetical protein
MSTPNFAIRRLTQLEWFHCGDELGLKTKVQKAQAWLDDDGLHIDNGGQLLLLIRNSDLLLAELFRLHGLCRVMRVEHRGGAVVSVGNTFPDCWPVYVGQLLQDWRITT